MFRRTTNVSMSRSAACAAALTARSVERPRPLPRLELHRLALGVPDRVAGDIREAAVVAEQHEPPLEGVEGPVLERPQQALDPGVRRVLKLLERALLRRRRGEPAGDGLEIEVTGRRGREAAEPGDHPRRREGGDQRAPYALSHSHTRLPPTISYDPLPPPLPA